MKPQFGESESITLKFLKKLRFSEQAKLRRQRHKSDINNTKKIASLKSTKELRDFEIIQRAPDSNQLEITFCCLLPSTVTKRP